MTRAAKNPTKVAARGRFTRRRILAGLLLVAGGLACSAGYWYWRRIPQPPTVNPEGVEGPVLAAIAEARAAVQQAPRWGDAWGRLGMVLLAHTFVQQAGIAFTQAEQLDPRDPRWPYLNGIALFSTDRDAAMKKWRRSAELCRDEPSRPRLRLADALLELGRTDDAARQFSLLLEKDRGHPLAHLGLAQLAYQQGDWLNAQTHLKRCIDSPYSRKAAHGLMAKINLQHPGRDGAAEWVRTANALPEDTPWPDPYAEALSDLKVDKHSRLKRASQLLEQNQPKEANALLKTLVRDEPEFDLAWRILGFTLLQQKDYAGAERALRRAIELGPNSADARYLMGCTLFNQKQYALAETHFRRATELKPDFATAFYNLGQALKLQGNRGAAIEAYREAIRSQPYMPAAHRELGGLLADLGRDAEAVVHLKQAVELDPKDPIAIRRLEKARPSRLP